MATALAEVNQRPVWRCDNCGLIQFPPAGNNCRKCHVALEPGPEPVIAMAAPLPAEPMSLAVSIKTIRLRKKLSQRELGKRMGVPRTYCSKCETGKTSPTLRSLRRLAAGLEVTVAELLDGREQKREQQVRELVGDAFLAGIVPFLPRLDGLQLRTILVQVSQLVSRVRRTA